MILRKIIEAKRKRLKVIMNEVPLKELAGKAVKKQDAFAFQKALQEAQKTKKSAFICEVKKASPSKGIISEDFPYIEIAKDYESAGADAISVLTEQDFFLGADEYLIEIKKTVNIPVLRKDFVINEYQIYESNVIGADAILLICEILEYDQLKYFYDLAKELGMSVLFETRNPNEIDLALKSGAKIIGVNNRDLKTFDVDINHSASVFRERNIPDDVVIVSESGITCTGDVAQLKRNGINTFLIGELLMRSENKKTTLESLRNAGADNL